jgi:hypothetical protein
LTTPLMTLIRAIVAGDDARAGHLLDDRAELATAVLATGATRQGPNDWFFEEIRHYVYAGDTALHAAAAAHRPDIVGQLLERGADVGARNRRGAEPLHYAVDGGGDAAAQRATVERLLAAGADPNAVDKSGVSPLHRAIRNRCADAVDALLEGGADPTRPNGKGSTPAQLAAWTTGKSGSGTPEAKAQQAEIVRLLATAGARGAPRRAPVGHRPTSRRRSPPARP